MSTEDANILEMSDEDAMNMPLPDDVEEEVKEPVVDVQETDNKTPDVPDTDDSGDSNKEVVAEEEVKDESPETPPKTTTEDSIFDDSTPKDADVKSEKEDTSTSEKKEAKDSEVDYKAEYAKLMAPFRANGKDMQINNVEDALTLMKQGANYNKKMAGLKPNLRLMKMLENNELLDEQKLAYLIDLNKKNPEAVQKLIKDSGIDPLEIDTEKDTEYTPGTYTVDDTEVELDAVLDDIRGTQSFNETIDIISNKWDASSKKELLKVPKIISVLNDQVDSGIFSQITNVIEHERMLGRLKGLSDLEAYRQVGDAIQKQGGFVNQQTPTKANPDSTPPKVNKVQDDPKLKNQKRAASSTNGKVTTTKKEDFNPLNMSDEDFEKAVAGQLY